MGLDKIMVEGIAVDCIIGCNEPERYKTQRINVHLTLHIDVSECGRTDALEHTVNYSMIAKRVVQVCKDAQCYTIEALCASVARECLFGAGCEQVQRVTVRIEKPEALKLARWPAVEIERDRAFFLAEEKMLGFSAVAPSSYSSLDASTSAGSSASAHAAGGAAASHSQVPAGASTLVKAYLSLGSNLGDRAGNISRALQLLQLPPVEARAAGSAAAGGQASTAQGSAVSTGTKVLRVTNTSFLYETPAAYLTDQPPFLNAACEVETDLSPLELLVHIKQHVEAAMGRPLPPGTLPGQAGASSTSYVRYGPRVIDVDILLYGSAQVVSIGRGPGEAAAGAGSAVTDSAAGSAQGQQEDLGDPLYLRVPHPRLHERDFQLGPLADIAPYAVHATARKTVTALLRLIPKIQLQRVLAFPARVLDNAVPSSSSAASGPVPGFVLPLGSRTAVMGILNVTPDSFSDGGQLMRHDEASAGAASTTTTSPDSSAVDLGAVVSTGRAMLSHGADILDVGGQSTRPNAVLLTPDQEAARVVPAIRALRQALGPTVPISVDTFYASVAEAAVAAGANCVNDVSGGTLEPQGREHMYRTVARLGVPYVLMHTRGTPQTMQQLAQYSPKAAAQGGFASSPTAASASAAPPSTPEAARAECGAMLHEVNGWLAQAADQAMGCGILRWNIVLDPGIGFAKLPLHSFALLGPQAGLKELRYPTLYGPSRKGFLGAATGKKGPQDRTWATAAAVTACVAVGADIVRVHDVPQMVDVTRTADAVFRGPFMGQ